MNIYKMYHPIQFDIPFVSRQSILLKKHAWLLTKTLYDVTSGNDKLIYVLVPSLQNLPHSFKKKNRKYIL
jgi:hypothetical protein